MLILVPTRRTKARRASPSDSALGCACLTCIHQNEEGAGVPLTVDLSLKLPRRMESGKIQAEFTRDSQQPQERIKEQSKPSDEFIQTWNDNEIQSFLQEWKWQYCGLRKRNSVVSREIAQHLKHKGIKKTWQECLTMLI